MRAEKQILLDQIKEKIQSSNTMIVTSYQSISADNAWEFRHKLREMNGSFEVVKKRIFMKASSECGVEVSLKELEGHIGIIFATDDAVGPAKYIFEFNKENGANLQVLYGFLDGQKYTSSDVKALSKLPAQKEMRAQFVGLLQAPMTQTLTVMQNLLTSIIYCLQNKSKQSS